MKVNFEKGNGLVPAIVQDAKTKSVLMLGYMNQESLDKTLASKKVTFFSRSRNELWVKGETSGNNLELVNIKVDCDQDTLLISANPSGPVCHTGAATCFEGENESPSFIHELEQKLKIRIADNAAGSYTVELINKGINKVAQKVGEEAVELVIEAKDDNEELFLGEAADLMYHYLVLLQAKGFGLVDVERVLRARE